MSRRGRSRSGLAKSIRASVLGRRHGLPFKNGETGRRDDGIGDGMSVDAARNAAIDTAINDAHQDGPTVAVQVTATMPGDC